MTFSAGKDQSSNQPDNQAETKTEAPRRKRVLHPKMKANLWKKGQSGNPAGRPKQSDAKTVADSFRKHAPDAQRALVSVMNNERSPASARVTAATYVLDRIYGKPTQTVDLDAKISLADEFEALIRDLNTAPRQATQIPPKDITPNSIIDANTNNNSTNIMEHDDRQTEQTRQTERQTEQEGEVVPPTMRTLAAVAINVVDLDTDDTDS